MMYNEELKHLLNHIINECEELAEWICEVHAAMGEDMYEPLETRLNRLYDEAINMSITAVRTRFAVAEHYAHYGNMKEEQ